MYENNNDEQHNQTVAEEPSVAYCADHWSNDLVVEMVEGRPEYHYHDKPHLISDEELAKTMSVDECRTRLLKFVHNWFRESGSRPLFN